MKKATFAVGCGIAVVTGVALGDYIGGPFLAGLLGGIGSVIAVLLSIQQENRR